MKNHPFTLDSAQNLVAITFDSRTERTLKARLAVLAFSSAIIEFQT